MAPPTMVNSIYNLLIAATPAQGIRTSPEQKWPSCPWRPPCWGLLCQSLRKRDLRFEAKGAEWSASSASLTGVGSCSIVFIRLWLFITFRLAAIACTVDQKSMHDRSLVAEVGMVRNRRPKGMRRVTIKKRSALVRERMKDLGASCFASGPNAARPASTRPLDCAHHDVRRGRAPRGHAGVPTRHLYCFGTDRERAIGLYRAPPISIPSVAALVVVPPELLAAFLDQGGYLDGTTVGTAYERRPSRADMDLREAAPPLFWCKQRTRILPPCCYIPPSFRPTLCGAPGGSIPV
jgi:hypothetical protein